MCETSEAKVARGTYWKQSCAESYWTNRSGLVDVGRRLVVGTHLHGTSRTSVDVNGDAFSQ